MSPHRITFTVYTCQASYIRKAGEQRNVPDSEVPPEVQCTEGFFHVRRSIIQATLLRTRRRGPSEDSLDAADFVSLCHACTRVSPGSARTFECLESTAWSRDLFILMSRLRGR